MANNKQAQNESKIQKSEQVQKKVEPVAVKEKEKEVEKEQNKHIKPVKAQPKALFICRQTNQDINTFYGYFKKYSGLFISARLVSKMIREIIGLESEVAVANDNNDIDRIVTQEKPTHVFIEAYWVVPEKFEVLAKRHPKVKWIVRIHSEIPFLSVEGMSMDWTLRYLDYPNVYLAPNSPRMFEDLKLILSQKYCSDFINEHVIYLPNYYDPQTHDRYSSGHKKHIDIGCFGSIRPLKNQLIQAIAAMSFADGIDMPLKFHINSNRVESSGDPVLKNLRQLFAGCPRHELVEHPWMPHGEFKKLIRTMEIGMQVSFTETFNIITADFVTEGIPVITSSEVWWLPAHIHANPNDTMDIIKKLKRVWTGRLFGLQHLNNRGLIKYANDSINRWDDFLLPNLPGHRWSRHDENEE